MAEVSDEELRVYDQGRRRIASRSTLWRTGLTFLVLLIAIGVASSVVVYLLRILGVGVGVNTVVAVTLGLSLMGAIFRYFTGDEVGDLLRAWDEKHPAAAAERSTNSIDSENRL